MAKENIEVLDLTTNLNNFTKQFDVCALSVNGKCELEEQLDELESTDKKLYLRVKNMFKKVAETNKGPDRYKNNTTICHQIEGKIFQLTVGQARILYYRVKGKMIICCFIFTKKTKKTPRWVINKAVDHHKKYGDKL